MGLRDLADTGAAGIRSQKGLANNYKNTYTYIVSCNVARSKWSKYDYLKHIDM